MEINIYSLKDPQTKIVRYVGKTIKTLKKRLSQHLNVKQTNTNHKANWIKQLKNKGLKPIIELLEICDENNWAEREKYWIGQFDNLTNLTTGGDGVNYFIPSVRKILSEKIKNMWLNDDFRNNQIKRIKEFWSKDENRLNQSNKIKGNKLTKEHIDIIKDTRKTEWTDNDYREKMSKQSKDLWKDDEYKKKVLNYIQSKEHKENVSLRFKSKPLSKEHREKMSKSSKNKKTIVIDNIEYESLTQASEILNIKRTTIKYRLKSKNFTNYQYKNK